jgi:hypothetical protein
MNNFDFFADLERALPPLASTKDLVTTGVYGSSKSAANDRWAGRGPAYVKIQRRIRYPRHEVISWLKQKAAGH